MNKKDIILITNNKQLIEQYQDELIINNSITITVEYINDCKYIIIDETHLTLEPEILEILKPYINKTLIIGYNIHDDFITINKLDFNIESIESYFNKFSNNDKNTECDIEGEIDSLLEKYVCDSISIGEISKSLLKLDKSLRNRFYNCISILDNTKISSLPIYNPIRIEYTLYKFKKHK